MRLFRREPFLGFRARVLFAFSLLGGGGWCAAAGG